MAATCAFRTALRDGSRGRLAGFESAGTWWLVFAPHAPSGESALSQGHLVDCLESVATLDHYLGRRAIITSDVADALTELTAAE